MATDFTDEEVLERSPYLDQLKRKARLAPSRLADLLTAAKARKAPAEPAPGECCGSSCKPCVTDLWKQELRCWNECHPDGEESSEDDDEDEAEPAEERKAEQGADRTGSPAIEIALEEKLQLEDEENQPKEGADEGRREG